MLDLWKVQTVIKLTHPVLKYYEPGGHVLTYTHTLTHIHTHKHTLTTPPNVVLLTCEGSSFSLREDDKLADVMPLPLLLGEVRR